MGRVRNLRITSIQPIHPPRQRSAATMGMGTREDGVQSEVGIYIDLGLKSDEHAMITMSTEKAVELATDMLNAAKIAAKVNREAAR